jgi:biopolymer transport protein ExbD
MKAIAIVLMCACLTGCATIQPKSLSFGDAVRTSLQDKGNPPLAVLVIQEDGSILVAGRPTTLAEIETIDTVKGLPESPGVLIEADRRTKHKDVRAVMDACTKAGIWRINFKAIKEGTQNQ